MRLETPCEVRRDVSRSYCQRLRETARRVSIATRSMLRMGVAFAPAAIKALRDSIAFERELDRLRKASGRMAWVHQCQCYRSWRGK